MRPFETTQTGVGSSALFVPDIDRNPISIGFGCDVTGTANYTVEHTFDNIQAPGFSAASAKWYPHPTVAALTADEDGTYAFPVRAIRVTINSGAGSVRFTIIQAGIRGA